MLAVLFSWAPSFEQYHLTEASAMCELGISSHNLMPLDLQQTLHNVGEKPDDCGRSSPLTDAENIQIQQNTLIYYEIIVFFKYHQLFRVYSANKECETEICSSQNPGYKRQKCFFLVSWSNFIKRHTFHVRTINNVMQVPQLIYLLFNFTNIFTYILNEQGI